jgi:hypothetical protein
LVGRIKIREKMDTHPRASARIERLELTTAGEQYASPVVRYGKEFLDSILKYVDGLSDEALLASILSTESLS